MKTALFSLTIFSTVIGSIAITMMGLAVKCHVPLTTFLPM